MKNIKYIGLTLATVLSLGFSGCGESSGDSTPPNTNVYNLSAINTIAPVSGLLEGGYSNGITGSLFLSRTNTGNDFVNGISVSKIKTDTSITLSNGYTSKSSSTALVDDNGFTLANNGTDANCTLTSNTQVIPTTASIGATSSATAIYSCDNSTIRAFTWKLLDAGGGNAYYIIDAVITGAAQSKSTTTLTITPQNTATYYKVYVDVIASGITGTFSGAIN